MEAAATEDAGFEAGLEVNEVSGVEADEVGIDGSTDYKTVPVPLALAEACLRQY